MEREFVDCIAETLKDFRDLVRSSAAVFYEVYRGAPDASMEKIFIENATDELLLRFDLNSHAEAACVRFCNLNEFESKAYGLPLGTQQMPLPYFGSYIPNFGRFDVAWTQDEALRLIDGTRKEKELAMQLRSRNN